MDLVNNYIYILEIPINIISKLRSILRQNFNSTTQIFFSPNVFKLSSRSLNSDLPKILLHNNHSTTLIYTLIIRLSYYKFNNSLCMIRVYLNCHLFKFLYSSSV